MANFDKIICVGKNYLEHARELGDAVPEKPVLFLKPPSALRETAGATPLELAIPHGHDSVHHECEIVVRIGALTKRPGQARAGCRLTIEEARAAITHVTLGLDLTLRELQTKLKAAGHPWEISKAFVDSALIGPWLSVAQFPDYLDAPFELRVDGAVRQKGRGRDMRLSPAECVAYASEHFALGEGDLVFTGTPAGVGPLRSGQTAELVWGDRLRATAHWRS